MIHPFLKVMDLGKLQGLTKIGFGKIAARVCVNGRIEAGFILGNGLPDVTFFFVVSTLPGGFETVPTVIANWLAIRHAIGLAVNFTVPFRDAATIIMRAICSKRAKTWPG